MIPPGEAAHRDWCGPHLLSDLNSLSTERGETTGRSVNASRVQKLLEMTVRHYYLIVPFRIAITHHVIVHIALTPPPWFQILYFCP